MAALACMRATQNEIDSIVAIQRELEKAITKGEEHTKLGQEFHNAIVMAAHNDFLLRLLPIIDESIDDAMCIHEKKMISTIILLRIIGRLRISYAEETLLVQSML